MFFENATQGSKGLKFLKSFRINSKIKSFKIIRVCDDGIFIPKLILHFY